MYIQRRRRGIGGIFIAVILIALLFVSLFFTFSFFESYLQGADIRSVISLDWSGYVATSSYLNPQAVMVGVNSSWTVPKVTLSQTDSFSAAWVGIGGQMDNTLIQVGTEHDSRNGQSVYYAWYELLPNISVTINSIVVSPGDLIRASISLLDSLSNEWTIDIRDVTTGQIFHDNLIYSSSRLSAEWVLERPTVMNALTSLADFGNAEFTDSYATVNATSSSIIDLPFLRVVMHDRQNNPLVSVSSLNSQGSGFTVSYMNAASIQTYSMQVLKSSIETSVTVRDIKRTP